jgi:UDP-N-acetylmuramate-alanine ligase
MYPFSQEQQLTEGAWLTTDKQIQTNTNNQQTIMSIHELAQQGKHNAYNSMASSIAGRVLEIRKEIIRESLSDFQNVEHRLEHVASVHGINFINDSKATNVNSTWYALESMDVPTIWIAGGVDKGNDYTMLEPLVKSKVAGGRDNVTVIICAYGKEEGGYILDSHPLTKQLTQPLPETVYRKTLYLLTVIAVIVAGWALSNVQVPQENLEKQEVEEKLYQEVERDTMINENNNSNPTDDEDEF